MWLVGLHEAGSDRSFWLAALGGFLFHAHGGCGAEHSAVASSQSRGFKYAYWDRSHDSAGHLQCDDYAMGELQK